jgi:hypothetical protein
VASSNKIRFVRWLGDETCRLQKTASDTLCGACKTQETVDPRQKTFLVEMAQAWQRLAERETHARNGSTRSVSELDRGD